MLACILLTLFTSACFGAPVEEEPEDVNLPPYIAQQFVDPAEDVVLVESDDPLMLSVDVLLDPNEESQLYYAVIGDRSGLVEQATASRTPAQELYRNAFYQFDGVDIEVDPCGERLADHDDEMIRLHVSDRPFERVTEAGVDLQDDAFLQTHQWVLRFQPHLCS